MIGTLRMTVAAESWPLREAFTISRGAKTEANVVVVTLADGAASGHGECTPYARYGESVATVSGTIEGVRAEIESGASRDRLQSLLPPGAARNAIDCALWDLQAKRSGRTIWSLLNRPPAPAKQTLYTVSLGPPDQMAQAAARAAAYANLKIKMGTDDAGLEIARLEAVTAAVPQANLVIDANEGWSIATLERFVPACKGRRVGFIEQPLPADQDDALAGFVSPVRLLADESCHDRNDLDKIADKYQAINVKLDKTGGLTEAIDLVEEARARNLAVVVGCMVSTSLSMAPAFVLSPDAELIDLDGPLLLARDRDPGIRYEGGLMHPPPPELWG